MSSAVGRKHQWIDKDIKHIKNQTKFYLSIYLAGIKWKNPYNIHLGYSIARLY